MYKKIHFSKIKTYFILTPRKGKGRCQSCQTYQSEIIYYGYWIQVLQQKVDYNIANVDFPNSSKIHVIFITRKSIALILDIFTKADNLMLNNKIK